MTLVDTNVLLDILSNDPVWFGWSADWMGERAESGPLFVNEVIVVELSARMESKKQVTEALRELSVAFERIPIDALFLAGQAFRRYRRSGGTRTGVLPDFFIGAHAQVTGVPILTRDTRRYRTYFPEVALIAPAGA